MRPDAHKQRASRRYQSAHRGASTTSTRGSSSTSRGGRGRGRGASGAAAPEGPRNVHGDEPVTPIVRDFMAQRDLDEIDEDAARGRVRAQFARRKIESNAYRYDEPIVTDEEDEDDDEDAAGINDGARATRDLETKLRETHLTDSSLARFKFKDERGWEEAAEADAVADKDMMATLDLAELNTRLAAVPFGERAALNVEIIQDYPDLAPAAVGVADMLEEDDTVVVTAPVPAPPVSVTAPAASTTSRVTVPPPVAAATALAKPAARAAAAPAAPALAAPTAAMEAWLDDFLDS
ncbi:hypothetical protein GGF31_001793 [Allomyces arbusculus]|nr:hypothetical protein GGF31_001793 [Allomyces arbusculus]